jgi:hypothetical protein
LEGFDVHVRGQAIGYAYAQTFQGDRFDLKPLVDRELHDSTIEAVKELFFAPDKIEDRIDDPDLFWAGFRAGIASWLGDQSITIDPPGSTDG